MTHNAFAAGEKAYIFHAVWFNRPHGAHRYREYLESASEIARKYGAKRIDALIPVDIIQGDFQPDYCFITEWPSMEEFNRFLRDPAYRAVSHLREEACKKRSLILCRRPSTWTHAHETAPTA
mgnify:CR=1 FL=1